MDWRKINSAPKIHYCLNSNNFLIVCYIDLFSKREALKYKDMDLTIIFLEAHRKSQCKKHHININYFIISVKCY